MPLRRLLSLLLTVGILMLGAPVAAVSAPSHHPAPADCAPEKTDESSPACILACLARTVCPPAPAAAPAANPAAGAPELPRPADDRIAGRSLGPEPPPPRS